MKRGIFSVFVVALFIGSIAQAQVDLETDQGFFEPGKTPYEEDDLDRAQKQNLNKNLAHEIKSTDIKIKDELGATNPQVMSRNEARQIDQGVVAENKRRQQEIFKTISSHSAIVKNCIDQNKKLFQGNQITVTWLIDQGGKVLNADIKSTDFNLSEVQECVRTAALALDFSSAAINQYKKSLVEYTYRVKIKQAPKPVKKIRPKRK